MIAFKEMVLVSEYENLLSYPALTLGEWLEDNWFRMTGQLFMVVTEVHYEGGSGVHAVGRAFDVSSKNDDGEQLPPHMCRLVQGAANTAWDYGKPPFDVCWYHRSSRQSAWHFHFQVRPGDETRLRDAVRTDG